jgi:hypothetical protein
MVLNSSDVNSVFRNLMPVVANAMEIVAETVVDVVHAETKLN